VYKNYIIASTASVLGSLMNSWVPIMKALHLVGQTSNNVIYENLYADIALRVSEWKKLVESITLTDEQAKYFPPDFIQLLSVGERTATVGVVCKKLNESYTREVNYSLANLTKWIEPIAILVAWVFVLWFAFAIFGAILQLTQTVG
jgi:type IV pilus assembly protein PilC